MQVLWGVVFVAGILAALGYYMYRHTNDEGEKTFPLNSFSLNEKDVTTAGVNEED